MSTPVVSVDQLCVALEQLLEEHLSATMADLGFTDPKYDRVKTWQQLPTASALSTAKMPAGAISSDGLVDRPKYSRSTRTWTATWRIGVGVYERGQDHNDTQARVRNWCAGIRTAVMRHKGLGGLAEALEWASEEYNLLPNREQARTVAAAAVAFDVTATVSLDPPSAAGTLPTVTSTATTVSVRPPLRRNP